MRPVTNVVFLKIMQLLRTANNITKKVVTPVRDNDLWNSFQLAGLFQAVGYFYIFLYCACH